MQLTAHICISNTFAKFGPLQIQAIPQTADSFRAIDIHILNDLPEQISVEMVPALY